jgi:iron complex outermembrane receptor protein
LGTANTDWQNEIYRAAISTDHNVSITGGTKNMPYRASLGYTLANGTIKTSQMQRVTAAVNLSPSFLDKHLNVNLNLKGMYIRNNYSAGVVGGALSMDPTMPVTGGSKNVYGQEYFSKEVMDKFFGGYNQPTTGANYNDPVWIYTNDPNTTSNPVAALYQQSNRANSGAFVGNLEVDYQIHGLEDLRIHANFGADYSYGLQRYQNSNYSVASHYYGWNSYEKKNKYNLQFNAYAQYYKDFNDDQHFDIMVGTEWQQFYNDYFSEGNGIVPMTNNEEAKRGQKINYSDEKYLLYRIFNKNNKRKEPMISIMVIGLFGVQLLYALFLCIFVLLPHKKDYVVTPTIAVSTVKVRGVESVFCEPLHSQCETPSRPQNEVLPLVLKTSLT